jgi:hypothetical protein
LQSALDSISDEAELAYRFWPRHINGEIDLLIEAPTLTIGIEVKYRSRLSSDDDTDLSDSQDWMESANQLARYQTILSEAAVGGKSCFLVFVAPIDIGVPVYQDVVRRGLIKDEIMFGLLTWENVLLALEDARPSTDRYRRTVVQDIVHLLRKKGFERFKGFDKALLPIDSAVFYKYESRYDYLSIPIKEEQAYEYR